MRDLCQKITKLKWFDKVTLVVIIVFSIIVLPDAIAMFNATTDKPYVRIIPMPIYTAAHVLTCAWFTFEMLVRIVAEGGAFFRSRRNLFELIMSALTYLSFFDWCAMLRLMRNIFSDSTEAPHRDERSGTMR